MVTDANLGLATTEELLSEVIARMHVSLLVDAVPNGAEEEMRALRNACAVASRVLPRAQLDYRTAD